jgi:nucleoside-diphosphate-sugar epimerase
MRVLVTGSEGYIGSVLTPMLIERDFAVVGLDAGWYRPCTFSPPGEEFVLWNMDTRDIRREDLEEFNAVMYLAALSNDPVGNLDPSLTFEINHRATMHFARLAKEAGVERFIFSSSCSLYGAAGDDFIDEDGRMNPVTAYGETKAMVDRELRELADDNFSPVLLRNATAYGASPRLRLDLVLNDLVASAVTTGKILMLSDGTPWRPIVHVQDICQAFIAAATAPREAIHNQAFNIGSTSENYRIAELAEFVAEVVPDAEIEYAPGATGDKRCYRVDFSKAAEALPGFSPQWNARRGARELYDAYLEQAITVAETKGPRYRRLGRLKELLQSRQLDESLRWTRNTAVANAASQGV